MAPPEPLRIGPWQVQVRGTGGVTLRRQAGLWLVLKGHLDGTTPEGLLELYQRRGLDFPLGVEGRFAALLLDGRAGRVLAVTDRLGSCALHAAHDGGRVLISTRPDWAPLRERPLSVAGVSSVLVKGNLIGGLGLYHGVSRLRRASVYQVGETRLSAHTYWTQAPLPALDLRPAPKLAAELAQLLRGAVNRHAASCGSRVYLALSGGYDSRGLLHLLAATGQDFQTFSYALPHALPGQEAHTDAGAAGRLAAQYGVPHLTLGSYRGDLPAHLRRTVDWAGGGAPLCDEADAWAEFAELGPSDVFTGDEAFDLCLEPLSAPADQLLRQKVPPSFEVLSWLRGTLPDASYAQLQGAWHATLDEVLAQAGAGPGQQPSPYALEMALMLDVNVAHSLLPWRECYAGRVARVHTPYMDGEVMDFLRGIPLERLAAKQLLKQALRQLSPDLMRVPLARSSGYVPDWTQELMTWRATLWDSVQASSSVLDALIPPQVIHILLKDLAPPSPGAAWKGAARQALGRLRRTPLGLGLFGRAAMRHPVSPTTFLRRVLVLRELTAPRPAAEEAPLLPL